MLERLVHDAEALSPILDVLPSGMLLTEGSEHRVRYVNNRSRAFWSRRPPGQLIGARAPDLFQEPQCAAIRAILDASYREDRVIQEPEVRCETPGGASYLRVTVGPLHEDGQVAGLLVVLEDVTVETHARRAAEEMLDLLSHELRRQVATIQAGLNLLRRHGPALEPPAREELLRDAESETARLTRLIQDLLTLGKAQAGAPPRTESIHAKQLLSELVARWQPEDPTHPLVLTLPPSLPPVQCVVTSVAQTLRNLVENARKHAPPWTPIEIACRPEDAQVRCSVMDHGPGVPPAEQERIFEPFYRGVAEPGPPGAGLGLTVARRLIEAGGGRIWVTNREGGGAAFHFTLPIAAGAQD